MIFKLQNTKSILILWVWATLQFLVVILPSHPWAANIVYTYDNLNRLTKIDYGNSVTEEYTYDSAGNRLTLDVTGTSAPNIAAIPASYNFGSVSLGNQSPARTFTISNTGTLALIPGAITLTGTDASAFSIQDDTCSGQTLAPAGTCDLQVVFAPTTVGRKSAALSIASNDPDAPVLRIAFSGTAPGSLPVVTITATQPTATEVGPTAGTFTVSRTGSTAAPLTVFYTVGGTATSMDDYVPLSGSVVIPAGSATATLTITPTNDMTAEGNETTLITLRAAAGYAVGTVNNAAGTIIDNPSPAAAVADSRINRKRLRE